MLVMGRTISTGLMELIRLKLSAAVKRGDWRMTREENMMPCGRNGMQNDVVIRRLYAASLWPLMCNDVWSFSDGYQEYTCVVLKRSSSGLLWGSDFSAKNGMEHEASPFQIHNNIPCSSYEQRVMNGRIIQAWRTSSMLLALHFMSSDSFSPMLDWSVAGVAY